MLYELSIIKYFLSYQEWCKWKDKLSVKDFPKELVPIYSVLDNFHQTHQQDLSVHDLANLVLAHQARDPDYYRQVLSNLESLDVSSTSVEVLLTSLHEQKLLKEISLTAYDITEGKGDRTKLDELLKLFVSPVEDVESVEDDFVTDDLEDLVGSIITSPGLRWRLNALNKMMGSLRKGNFGFVFARSETGKSTLIASEVSHMATQIPPGGGPIIWCSNEEPGKSLKLRIYQAHFGIDLVTLMADLPGWGERYAKEMGGKIQIYDRPVLSSSSIELLCAKYSPSLLIIDAIDKVSGFDKDRDDLRLGAIYQWARTLAKTYCPVIGVCQADGTAEGVKWLTMGHVDGAKTSKQKEADFILGIGKTHEVGYENLRYLHLSKNKLPGDGPEITDPSLRHGRVEVLIEPHIARYRDI